MLYVDYHVFFMGVMVSFVSFVLIRPFWGVAFPFLVIQVLIFPRVLNNRRLGKPVTPALLSAELTGGVLVLLYVALKVLTT